MIRLFDPTGLKAMDYKSTYPELARTTEFESLSGTELMFVWHYANATSPLIDLDENTRVKEALGRSGFMPSPTEKEKLLKLQFGERLEHAIEKMGTFNPGVRYFGWKSLKTIFSQYQEIAQMSPDELGELDDYVNITTKIAKAMPDLMEKLEEGFGISMSATEEEEEGTAMLRDWNLNRRKQ